MRNSRIISRTATGKRVDIVTNAVTQAEGTGPNLLPGKSAGAVATGANTAELDPATVLCPKHVDVQDMPN